MTKEKEKEKAWRNLKVAAASNSQTFSSLPNEGPSTFSPPFLLQAGRGLPHTIYIFFYSRAQIQAKQTNLPINITNVRAKNNKKY